MDFHLAGTRDPRFGFRARVTRSFCSIMQASLGPLGARDVLAEHGREASSPRAKTSLALVVNLMPFYALPAPGSADGMQPHCRLTSKPDPAVPIDGPGPVDAAAAS